MAVLLFSAGAVVIVATVVMTAMRYRDLPETIPIHFGIDGTANSYGPRVTAWMLPAIQVVIAFTYAAIYTTEGRLGFLVMGVGMLAIFWRAQLLILSTAMSGKKRAPLLGFLIFFTITLAVAIWAMRF